jgi:hypothetical protein
MKIGLFNNIKNLAPTLAENFVDEEISKNIYTEYSNKIGYYRNIIGIGSKYFFGHLHDSTILSLKIKDNNLRLLLDDISTYEFACALIDKMKLKNDMLNMKFPLEIRTEGTKHLSLNIVDTEGNLYKNKFVKVKEYLYEEIIDWSNENIEIAFDLWSKPGCRYLLLVSCKKVKFIENQNKYWEKYFGEKYNEYYEYFINERNKGKYLSDYMLCKELINKIAK